MPYLKNFQSKIQYIKKINVLKKIQRIKKIRCIKKIQYIEKKTSVINYYSIYEILLFI